MFEGLTYLQQRQDALAQQAEEMALRNAFQRLNSEEFSYRKQRDTNQDLLAARQQDTENQFKERTIGIQEKNTDARIEQGDLRLKQGQQKIDLAAQQFAGKLDAQRQGQFLQQYRFLIGQGYDPSDALADAMARTHGEAALNPQAGQAQTPAQPQVNVLPQQNPLDMIPGLSAPPAGQEQAMGGDGTLGVSPRAQMDMQAKAAQAMSREAYARQVDQRFQQNAAMFGIKRAAAIAQKELAESRKAEVDARVEKMNKLLPYDEILKSYDVKSAVTKQEIEKLKLLSAQEDRQWQKQLGSGSGAAVRVQQQAETRAGVLFGKRTSLNKEKHAVKQMVASYRAVIAMPMPGTDDAKYAEKIERQKLAREILPGLEARSNQIAEDLKALDTLDRNNNRFRNIGVQPVTPAGKPMGLGVGRFKDLTPEQERRYRTRPPAVVSPPKVGARGAAKVTPPPAAKSSVPVYNLNGDRIK